MCALTNSPGINETSKNGINKGQEVLAELTCLALRAGKRYRLKFLLQTPGLSRHHLRLSLGKQVLRFQESSSWCADSETASFTSDVT